MRIGIIGAGAIAKYVVAEARQRGYAIAAQLVRPGSEQRRSADFEGIDCFSDSSAFIHDLDLVLECAGHSALRSFGPAMLRAGTAMTTVSLGALADEELQAALRAAARHGNTQLHLASGAIGALDCLRAARVGGIDSLVYCGRKPPVGWRGSPAEAVVDLNALQSGAVTHFEGSARDAAHNYPKNANVAAAVALAGVGFDKTRVELIADADISDNIHEIRARGDFGSFHFSIRGRSLPDNPRSSALAAMSVVSALEQRAQPISF